MNRRQRVLDACNFKETDRVPMDLGGMRSSSISCFNYRDLVKELGLKDRLPMVYDDGQMLAIPERDVLDALDCDVVYVGKTSNNAFDIRDRFKKYDYNKRLEAMVFKKNEYKVLENNTLVFEDLSMTETGTVFTPEHGGQMFDLMNIHKKPISEIKEELENDLMSDYEIDQLAKDCRRAREESDRAIFLNDCELALDFAGGIANGSMLCLLDPEYIHEVNKLKLEYSIKSMSKILPLVKENVDIVLTGNKDMGTQNATIVSPDILREQYLPYFKIFNGMVHEIDSNQKTFLHSCGAIYDILDDIIDSDFDILNPIQWTAGGHSYKEWKDKARNKITFWGGGVDAQHVLPLLGEKEVEKQVVEVVNYLKKDGGFVFCNIHNITADIKAKNITAMYRAAKSL